MQLTLISFVLLAASTYATPLKVHFGDGHLARIGLAIRDKHQSGNSRLAYVRAEKGRLRNKYQKSGERLAKRKHRPIPTKPGRDATSTTTLTLQDQFNATGGGDVLYYGTVGLGTPPQIFKVDFDTGSSDIIIPNTQCDVENGCPSGRALFDADLSDSFVDANTPFQIEYGSGSAQGETGIDTVTVGNLTVQGQYFGSIATFSDDFGQDDSDGIFGLGFSTISVTGKPTFVESAAVKGEIQPIFGMSLQRHDSGILSEITFGGVDSSRFTGAFTQVPVTVKGYWQVAMDNAVVNGKVVAKSSSQAAIDSGTTLIVLPTFLAKKIYAAIPGGLALDSEGNYGFPCDAVPRVALTFGGKAFAINPLDLNLGPIGNVHGKSYCLGAITGEDLGTDGVAIVGDSWMKQFYVQFNAGTRTSHAYVGIAQSAAS